MSALCKINYLSEQDYLAHEISAECRHEYLDGQIYAMAGANESHNRISLNIVFQLRSVARGGRCGVLVSDMKLRIEQNKAYYYPDVMLVCDATDAHDYFKQQPCLIAEVLSPGTAAIDRREKLLAYQKIAGLRYYLLINANCPRVEYFLRDAAGEWQTAWLEANEMLSIDCENYHAVLSLDDIYEDLVFE